MPLITPKHNYTDLERIDGDEGRRYLCPSGDAVPSVTRILGATKAPGDKKKLDDWIKRVGKKAADDIKNEACAVGTYMHKCLECDILGEEYIKFDPLFTQARSMANTLKEKCFDDIDEIWGTEVKLYYPEKYAGTTDVVGVYKGNECIMDFKQTNKPKRREWIGDYFLQLCAYAHAHNKVYGTEIKSGVVLMCSRDYQVQTFELHTDHFYHFSEKWFDRLEKFYDLDK